MKNIKFLFPILALFVMLSACNKSDDDTFETTFEGDYLIFGSFYGFCIGEQCIEIFKLESDALYEDSSDNYPNQQSSYEGNFIQLSEEKFQIADGLFEDFPTALLTEQDTVFGIPDAYDQGGLYVEIMQDGEQLFWIFDNNKDVIPEQYHDFHDKIHAIIQEINQ